MLRYGNNLTLDVAAWSTTAVTEVGAQRLPPIADLAAAVRQALASPLDFPPLQQAVVPGDRITLAIAPGIPRVGEVLRAIIPMLQAAGISAHNIQILAAAESEGGDELSEVAAAAEATLVAFERHEPGESASLAYLAATHEAQPIYLHRALVDADFVLPMGPARPAALGGLTAGSILYPRFSDARAETRAQQALVRGGESARQRLRRETDDVTWLMGAQFGMQLVAGLDDQALAVVAGSLPAVFDQAAERLSEAWGYAVDEASEFIVAAISGTAAQSWSAVANVLRLVERVARPEATVVICTSISTPPSPTLRRLAAGGPAEKTLRQAIKQHRHDASESAVIHAAAQKYRLSLLSELPEELVEEIGIGAVASPAQLVRVARRHATCLAIANAHLALPRLAHEAPTENAARHA